MSYLIVKGLKIDKKQKKVFVKCASSNVYPKTFEWSEFVSLSEIYQNEGLEAIEKEILYLYWSGEFQKTNNIYDNVVKYWKNLLPYTWQSVWGKKHTRQQVKDGLYDGYQLYKKRKKGKFVLVLQGTFDQYVMRKTPRYTYYTHDVKRAKIFNSYEEASIFIGGSIFKYGIIEID